RGIFLTHGEPEALTGLAQGLAAIDGIEPGRTIVPTLDQCFQLVRAAGALVLAAGKARLVNRGADALDKGWDWHNELSAFILDLHRQLQDQPSDKERLKLIRDLKRVIGRK